MKQSDLNNYQTYPQSLSMKIGRHIIAQLKDHAVKESMRRQLPVTTTQLIKEAIKHTYPFIKD